MQLSTFISPEKKSELKSETNLNIALEYPPGDYVGGKKPEMKEEPIKPKVVAGEKKDPTTAALIALAGGLLLGGASGAGYIYLGKVKKGIVYIVAAWLLVVLLIVLTTIGGALLAAVTFGLGAVCVIPLWILAPAFVLAIVYDVYLEASGKKTILPDIKE